ncbi:MAG: hypothetical protein B7Z71_13765 [Acidocella sp. 21-58-7]|nr:MAG: hypothetical protein B7Z71_13765 [Acidocella sp. 21-58-7]
MTKANYSLRLQPSLKNAAERIATAEGTSVNQFINVAVAEKIAAMEAEAYFTERARKGSRTAFLAFLDGAGDSPPNTTIGE